MHPHPLSENAVKRSRLSLTFDVFVVIAGLALALVALGMSLGELDSIWPVLLLSVPVMVVTNRFPVLIGHIGRTGSGFEVGLESCVLIFLANVVEPVTTLTVWSIGAVLTQLSNGKSMSTKWFNIGLAILAAGLALAAMEPLRVDTLATGRQVAATSVGALVYFCADLLLTAVSLRLEEGKSLREQLTPAGVTTALTAFLAIASLGLLAAMITTALPPWSAALLAAPAITVVVAGRALSRGREYARRSKVLLHTAANLQRVLDRPALLDALMSGARQLLKDHRVSLSREQPRPDEIGVAIPGVDDELWIVSPLLKRSRVTALEDTQAFAALVAVAEDAFARLRLGAAMTHLAWHDPLTGLANRSLFMNRMQQAMQPRPDKVGAQFAVLFCDLDGFKRVNDLFGHAAGDELLVKVGARIKAAIRSEDTVSRLGGDEFAVLIENVTSPDDVDATCQRILEALRERVQLTTEEVSVTTTIGVAMSTTGGSADSLLSQADLAMYQAKRHGKDRYEIYRLTLGDERRQRIELVENLRRAVDARDLEVFYQPIVDLGTREISGVEALVRWRRNGELISPDLFVPVAEESGLIVSLDRLVLDLVVTQAPHLRAAAGRQLTVSVNISAQELLDDGFMARVRDAQQAMGDIDLVLEMTERDFVGTDYRTLAVMDELAAANIRFAIDDFGVGFSSFGYLQRLPVSILKIDKSFIDGIERNARARTLVRSVIVMAEALDIDVVIEGIERESQLYHLTAFAGTCSAQGYLFARPMPYDEMVATLSHATSQQTTRVADGTAALT